MLYTWSQRFLQPRPRHCCRQRKITGILRRLSVLKKSKDMDIVQQAIVARRLPKKLEHLCIDCVLNEGADCELPFAKLPPALVGEIVKKLLEFYEDRSWWKPRVSHVWMVCRLINKNLRTFHSLMVTYESELLELQWRLLMMKCSLLRSFTSQVETVDELYLSDAHSFPNLQELSILGIYLKCEQIENIPDWVPHLKKLEVKMKDGMKRCCLDRLCLLTDMEQLAIDFSCCPENKDGYLDLGTVWANFLQKMPHLQILTEHPKEGYCILPCFAAALVKLQEMGHNKPLQLTHLCLTEEGVCDLKNPPLHLLPNITCLWLRYVPIELTTSLVLYFGKKLTELKVNNHGKVDLILLLNCCSRLENVELCLGSISLNNTKLPEKHFAKLQRFEARGMGDGNMSLPNDMLQLVLESPNLQRFTYENKDLDLALIYKISRAEGAFKNLKQFSVMPSVDKDNPGALVNALGALIAAAPKLSLLDIEVADEDEKELLEELLSCPFGSVPDLHILIRDEEL